MWEVGGKLPVEDLRFEVSFTELTEFGKDDNYEFGTDEIKTFSEKVIFNLKNDLHLCILKPKRQPD